MCVSKIQANGAFEMLRSCGLEVKLHPGDSSTKEGAGDFQDIGAAWAGAFDEEGGELPGPSLWSWGGEGPPRQKAGREGGGEGAG